MAEPEHSNPELLKSLGRLVRGLSGLFWGLPLALIICVQTSRNDLMHSFGVVPPVLACGWLFYSLHLLEDFQKQERVWHRALDRAKVLGLVNIGLAPFLYWWKQFSMNSFFTIMICLMALTGLIFLSNLNVVLRRLVAMLPDEALRQETNHFTAFNRLVLALAMVFAILYFGLWQFPDLPDRIIEWLLKLQTFAAWLLLFLVLLPLAMTMALLWKTKEVILASLFAGR
jgi:hypothetical protein